MKLKYLILLCTILLCQLTYGQEKTKEITHTIHYSFTNVSSEDQIESLENDISKLKNVVKIKSEYKIEKAAGQITVVVTDEINLSEGSDNEYFDARDLKQLIVKNGLTPNQIHQEEVLKK